MKRGKHPNMFRTVKLVRSQVTGLWCSPSRLRWPGSPSDFAADPGCRPTSCALKPETQTEAGMSTSPSPSPCQDRLRESFSRSVDVNSPSVRTFTQYSVSSSSYSQVLKLASKCKMQSVDVPPLPATQLVNKIGKHHPCTHALHTYRPVAESSH